MAIKEELELIQESFDEIREMASSKRTANGVLMSSERLLEEISVKAKECKEYIDLLLTTIK